MKIAAKGGKWLGVALALAVGPWAGPQSTAEAGDGPLLHFGHHAKARLAAAGTLGYGPPGLHPGFQVFGLRFHRGYGYGGDALGVGAEGGDPFYGGPGYPHPAPALNRIGRTTPFPYYGGPGGPTPAAPHYFDGGAGPLVIDRPVIASPGDSAGYGTYSGMMPYPDSTFAPDTAQASGETSAPGVTPAVTAPVLVPGGANP